MLLDVGILADGATIPGKMYEQTRMSLMSLRSQLVAAEAFVDCQARERPASERVLSATSTTAVVASPGLQLATA